MIGSRIFRTMPLLAAMVFVGACGGGDDDVLVPTGAPLCSSSGQNAFDTYGASAFVAVNEAIVGNVVAQTGGDLASAELGSSFQRIANRVPSFKGNLAAFLVFAYGGPDSITYTDGVTYDGASQDMTTVHTGLAITSAQYDFFVSDIIVPALQSSGVPAEDISSCFAPVVTAASFKNGIVDK